jgi:replicative DNA helicase
MTMTEDGRTFRLMESWQNRTNGTPVHTAATVTRPLRTDRANYTAAAISDECRQVREAPEGQRNHQLNTSALKLGRLVAGGLADEDDIRAELIKAGRASGLTARETAKTVSSGMREGMASAPRDPGEKTSGNGAGAVRDLTDRLGGPALVVVQPATVPVTPDLSGYLVPGAEWLLELPEAPEAVWGTGDTVLWAQGEALMIAGGPGLGKTTLAGQLVRARLGLQPSVLELPVTPGGRLLYLAMDRPQQIGRRLRQQFGVAELQAMVGTGRLVLGIGPPPQDLARHPELLPQLCVEAGADTLVVDSLKDAAVGLTDDEVASGYNRARQMAVTAGVQVLELHHLVKRGADGKAPTSLADVYGSAWLTAGAGSVLLLSGGAGDPVVRAHHLKQPMAEWGPLDIAHDHAKGVSSVAGRVDLLELLAMTTVQTATTAAQRLYATEKPTRGEKEKARRQLEALVAGGKATKRPGRSGGADGGTEAQYVPLTVTELGDI